VRARGEIAFTGDRGFVMVRARPETAAIRAALEHGDFYASTGVVLTEVGFEAGVLSVRAADPAATLEVVRAGAVVHRGMGAVSFPTGGGVTRVRVTDAAGRHAWTQPFGG